RLGQGATLHAAWGRRESRRLRAPFRRRETRGLPGRRVDSEDHGAPLHAARLATLTTRPVWSHALRAARRARAAIPFRLGATAREDDPGAGAGVTCLTIRWAEAGWTFTRPSALGGRMLPAVVQLSFWPL